MGNKDVKMAHASLFSGIGGAELAASWMGWDNKFHCEINPFCRKILEYHFPESISYEDISKTDFSDWRGQIDVLTGGFPCQPFSLAGKRKGAEDNRYLWPQMLRAIREIRPTWVVGENVAGILTMVQPGEETEMGFQTSIFGEDDRKRILHRQEYVVETICRDLECEGYSVQPIVIPACAVGAPHRRDRIWFVAHRTDTRDESMQCSRENGIHAIEIFTDTQCFGGNKVHQKVQPEQPDGSRSYCDGNKWYVADTSSEQLENTLRTRERLPEFANPCCKRVWQDFPTQSPVCSGDDGLSTRLDGITFSKWRQESIKAYGNAWVPQVAYEIFMAIGNVMECK